MAAEPYKFRLHIDPDGTQHLILDSRKPIPIRWSTIVGDVIHNARSALDLMVSHAASLEANKVKELPFPIFRHQSVFDAKAFNNFGNDCPRTVRFLKLLKPYERGSDAGRHSNTLVLLNRLSVRDKHHLIVPVGSAAGYATVTPNPGFGESFKLVPPDPEKALLMVGEVIMTISPFDPTFANKDFQTQIDIQLRLGDIEGLPRLGAPSMLRHIVKIVDRIVGIAERRLFARRDTYTHTRGIL